MPENGWNRKTLRFLALVLLLLLVSGSFAAKKKKNKKKNRNDIDSYNKYGRAGIKPLQKITKGAKSSTVIKTTPSSSTQSPSSPRRKSLPKFTSETSSRSSVETKPVTRSEVKTTSQAAPKTSKSTKHWSLELIPVIMDNPSVRIFPTALGNVSSTTSTTTRSDFPDFSDVPTTSIRSPAYRSTLSSTKNPYVCEDKRGTRTQEYRLCGYPSIYNQTRCSEIYCSKAPLSMCEKKAEMVVFGIITLLLGACIIAGNCLLPCIVYKRRNMRNNHNYIKVSLAFADILIGILLVSSVLPNMFWIRSSSEIGIVDSVGKETNSVTAVLAGSLLVVSFESSLLHLTFLSLERFLALHWSFKHRRIPGWMIGLLLSIIWVISALLAFVPAIFPDKFEYTILPVLFVYMLTAKSLPDGQKGYEGQLYGGITMLLPYALMVILCVLTGIAVGSKLRKSRDANLVRFEPRCNALSSDSVDIVNFPQWKTSIYATEIRVFKTLLIMITAFSVTLLPIVVILVLFNTSGEHLDCENYSLAYTLAFFGSLSNSLVNVIVYTMRDERFREALVSELSAAVKGKHDHQRKIRNRKQQVYSTGVNTF